MDKFRKYNKFIVETKSPHVKKIKISLKEQQRPSQQVQQTIQIQLIHQSKP